MSLHQAHILLNNGVADLTIPFTNMLSEFIILLLKLNTKLRKSSPKDGNFKITHMSEALLYLSKLSNLLRPLLEAIFNSFVDVMVLSNHIDEQHCNTLRLKHTTFHIWRTVTEFS